MTSLCVTSQVRGRKDNAHGCLAKCQCERMGAWGDPYRKLKEEMALQLRRARRPALKGDAARQEDQGSRLRVTDNK